MLLLRAFLRSSFEREDMTDVRCTTFAFLQSCPLLWPGHYVYSIEEAIKPEVINTKSKHHW